MDLLLDLAMIFAAISMGNVCLIGGDLLMTCTDESEVRIELSFFLKKAVNVITTREQVQKVQPRSREVGAY